MRSLGVLLTLCAGTASAEVLTLPQGCTPIASVQHRGCQVSLFWECAGDEGYVTASADESGLLWATQRASTGQWTEMVHMPSGSGYVLGDARDPSDHRAIAADGQDAFDYTMVGTDGAMSLTYVGTNTNEGPGEIDGAPVIAVVYDYDLSGPEGPIRRMQGRAYLWSDRLISISGSWISSDGASAEVDPVEILTKGEPGFMDATPRYDCGEEMS